MTDHAATMDATTAPNPAAPTESDADARPWNVVVEQAAAPARKPASAEGEPVSLDGRLTVSALRAVVDAERPLRLGASALRRIEVARARLERCLDERRVVYGLSTGFGPLANRLVDHDEAESLQRNLVYHLASGVGGLLSWRAARAVALARLSSIAQGWSGASLGATRRLEALLASDLAPTIPEKGTVGASGDLTPLAHLALCLMGEAPFLDREERLVPAEAALARIGIAPLTLKARDGLALVNGTSAMTAVAALNADVAERLAAWSEALTVAQAEVLGGRSEAWSAGFARARPHPGQAASSQRLRERAHGSEWIDDRRAADRILDPAAVETESIALQDPYTLRCAPQVVGAARDVIAFHRTVVERELNAATDNPIFDEDAPYALHGGNFMGCQIALASDALSNAIVMLAGATERRIARLTDESRNRGLPAFLCRGRIGVSSGFMGAQVTATALVAEMRARGGAASTQSLSTNGDNQDVVSMGTIAARGAATVLEDAGRVLAIEALATAQAVEIRADEQPDRRFSASTRGVLDQIRSVAAPLIADRPLSSDIDAAAMLLRVSEPDEQPTPRAVSEP